MSVSIALENIGKDLLESPHYRKEFGRLLFVDINAGDIHCLSDCNDHHKSHIEGSASFVIPATVGGIVVGNDQKLVRFETDSGEISTLAELENKAVRFNDGKCDASGRLWTGTLAVPSSNGPFAYKSGALYSLDKTQGLRKHLDGIDISNGLAWTMDNKTMFFIDSLPRKVYAFDFDLASGTISNQRVVVDFNTLGPGMGLPDGMTIDSEDKLWVACFNGSKVVRIDPATGEILREVTFPVKQITSCCFGGQDHTDLYVTSARYRLTDEEVQATQPKAGSLFKVTELGVRGLPANEYEG